MMRLPTALTPWASALDIFPEDVQATLGPWLPRLAAAFGPFRAQNQVASGAPDGFRGLSRKGTYERLLPSEWLLATEHPEEFMRRAANAEHTFYAWALKEPAGIQRSIALIDSGPHQLGGPRLVHLASLVLLSVRAERAHSSFEWGILQAPEPKKQIGLTKETVIKWVRSRSAEEANASHFEKWWNTFEADHPGTEVWVIGGRRTAHHVEERSTGFVMVEEPIALEEDTLSVTVHPPRGPTRSLELALPEPSEAVRLVRDPFGIQRSPPVESDVLSTRSPPLFSGDGRRVFMRTATGVTSFHITKQGPPGKPRNLSARNRSLLAVGMVKRSYYLVTASDERVYVLLYSRRGRLQRVIQSALMTDEARVFRSGAHGTLSPAIANRLPNPTSLAFMDPAGQLFSVSLEPDQPIRGITGGVNALWQTGGRRLIVVDQSDFHRALILHPNPRAEGPLQFMGVLDAEDKLHVERRLPDTSDLITFAGRSRRFVDARLGLVAVRVETDTWMVLDGHRERNLKIDATLRPIGIAASSTRHLPGIVALSPDNRHVHFIHVDGRKEERRLWVAARQAAVSPAANVIAYTAESGELIVEHVETAELFLRTSTGTPARDEDAP